MRIVALILVVAFIIGTAGAVTTGAATGITSNSSILHGTACSGTTCWFEYGHTTGLAYPWRSYNTTATAGAFAIEISGLPLITGQTVYYRAIDANGDRGNEQSFVLLAAVVVTPEPTFGQHVQNLTRYKFRIPIIALEIPGPYTDVTPSMAFYAVVFFFLYGGIWVASKNTLSAITIGVTTSFLLMLSPTQTIGLSPEFVNIGEGLLIASIAALIFLLFKR